MIDINLDEGAPTINTDTELIIQQIDLLFDTNKREVFGSPNYGTNYDNFLYNMTLSNDAIAFQVKGDLEQLDLFGYTPSVEVNILEGTLNDIILITIGLERNNSYYEKTYELK